MKMAALKILIADDSVAIRRALRDLLSHHPGEWTICGEVADGNEALRMTAQLLPDVVLLDLSIPSLHGLKVAEILRHDCPQLVIVIMSEQDATLMGGLATAAGVSYAIPKSRLAIELTPLLLSIRDHKEKQGDDAADIH